jgi:predicted RNase H-like HicB family nuclease
MRYAIVVEKAANNYSAYAPDIPGCVATGDTVDEVKQHMQAAIAFHLDGMRAEGLPLPQPQTVVEYVETDVAA